jgi:hypothetical protein
MMWFRKAKPLSVEQQLAVLKECGIEMRPDLTIDDLLHSNGRDQYEKEPFELLLITLAGEVKREPFCDFSDNIWHLNRRCIHDQGSYVQVAAKMSRLTGFTLPIADAKDYVSPSEGNAWLSFSLDGMPYRWDLVLNGDLLDHKILSKFADLLKLVGAGKRFFYLELKDQESLISCARPDQVATLREKTKLDFQWLV